MVRTVGDEGSGEGGGGRDDGDDDGDGGGDRAWRRKGRNLGIQKFSESQWLREGRRRGDSGEPEEADWKKEEGYGWEEEAWWRTGLREWSKELRNRKGGIGDRRVGEKRVSE